MRTEPFDLSISLRFLLANNEKNGVKNQFFLNMVKKKDAAQKPISYSLFFTFIYLQFNTTDILCLQPTL